MRAFVAVAIVVCACGRLDFDALGDGGGGTDGNGTDGPQAGALLFHYALEDDPNVNGADDSSGNGRLAPCLNPNPCPLLWDLDDLRGTSRICDFEDGTLRVPHDAELGMVTASFTIALWVKAENAGGCLVAMPGAWKLCAVGANTVSFTVMPGGSNVMAPLVAEWSHVAIVWSGTASTIYVDGVLGGTVGGTMASPAAGAVVGASDVAGTAERLDGWLDDIRLYRTALSDAEIVALYQQN